MFEYLYKNSKNVAPVTKAEAADVDQIAMDLYPWEDRLSDAKGSNATLVDIAGSHGNGTRAIMALAPKLNGCRFIVQDLEPVIGEHSQALRAEGIEPQVYDFLKQEQPVHGKSNINFFSSLASLHLSFSFGLASEFPHYSGHAWLTNPFSFIFLGASIYYFRRVFHDWPDLPEGKKILDNTRAAMSREHSRILIHDIIVPEIGATMSHAWQDLSLMAIGGMERTEKDFARLLDIAGLALVKVWRKPGDMMGIIEARLK